MSFFLFDSEESKAGEEDKGPMFNFFGETSAGSDESGLFDGSFCQSNNNDDGTLGDSFFFTNPKVSRKDKTRPPGDEKNARKKLDHKSPVDKTFIDKKDSVLHSVGQMRPPPSKEGVAALKPSHAVKRNQQDHIIAEAKQPRISPHNGCQPAPDTQSIARPSTPPIPPAPFKHPIQVLNELSPPTSNANPLYLQTKESTIQATALQSSMSLLKEENNKTKNDKECKSFSRQPGRTELPPSPFKSHLVAHQNISATPSAPNVVFKDENPTLPSAILDTDILSRALMFTEYGVLKDSLSSLPAAKSSGNFVFQVAKSVDALFKCSQAEKNKDQASLQDRQNNVLDKIGAMHGRLNTQLQEINDDYQAIVDQKLAKLSAILDEIKVNKEELAKFRVLLRSFSLDITQHNEH